MLRSLIVKLGHSCILFDLVEAGEPTVSETDVVIVGGGIVGRQCRALSRARGHAGSGL
jgi:hypothetical protein